jgi:hypothetical protein
VEVSQVRAGAYLYPWDVDGDPAAAGRVAGLGLTGVSLAAAYHAVRALTPFHPGHRIVTRDAAVYYQADPDRWSGAALRPTVAEPAGSFERAAGQVRAAGLGVTAWMVLTHNSTLAGAAGGAECAVRNAFGDRYPWALCAGSAAVREYAARLAAEVAGLDGVDGIELEACGWYGFEHGSAHDKTGSVMGRAGPAGAGDWLLSLCFCAGCRDGYAAAGADPDKLAAQVRAAADGGPALPADVPDLLDSTRAAAAQRLLGEVTAAVRTAAPGQTVLLHTDPDPRATGSNPGYDLAAACGPGGVDGVVLACADPARAVSLVTTATAALPAGASVVAVLQAVAGLGADPATLPAQAAAVRAAGATELRFYHAGLATASDLAAIRAALADG